jgi:hypothetical protein
MKNNIQTRKNKNLPGEAGELVVTGFTLVVGGLSVTGTGELDLLSIIAVKF